MLKLVLSSMRSSFRLTSYRDSNLIWLPIFFLMLTNQDTTMGPFPLFMVFTSIIIIVNFPNRITKGMFLCPTTYPQRKQFIIVSIVLKTCLLTGIFVAGSIVSYFIIGFPPISILISSLYYLTLVLVLNLSSIGWVLSKEENTDETRKIVNSKYRLPRERVLSMCCYFLLLFAFIVCNYLENFNSTQKRLHLVLLLINTLFVSIYVIKYAKYLIRISVDYQAIYTPMMNLRRSDDAYYNFLNK